MFTLDPAEIVRCYQESASLIQFYGEVDLSIQRIVEDCPANQELREALKIVTLFGFRVIADPQETYPQTD